MNYTLLDNPHPIEPQYTTSRPGPITGIVLHMTAGAEFTNGDQAINTSAWASHPEAEVSWHTTIDLRTIIPVLPDEYRAWHAGRTHNDTHIGIEVCGHPKEWLKHTEEDRKTVLMNVAVRVSQAFERHGELPPIRHSVIDPTNRTDPGWLDTEIEWVWETARGLRAKYAPLGIGSTGLFVQLLQRNLGVDDDGIFGPLTDTAVRTAQGQMNLPVTGIAFVRRAPMATMPSILFGPEAVIASMSMPDNPVVIHKGPGPSDDDIRTWFVHQAPTPEALADITEVRQYIQGMVEWILSDVPNSPERTIALRKMHETQQATLWAIIKGAQ